MPLQKLQKNSMWAVLDSEEFLTKLGTLLVQVVNQRNMEPVQKDKYTVSIVSNLNELSIIWTLQQTQSAAGSLFPYSGFWI